MSCRKAKAMKLIFPFYFLLLCTPCAMSQELPGRYSVSWLGNTYGKGHKDPNSTEGQWIQNYIDSMFVDKDGTCYTASIWDEGGRTHGVYKDVNNISDAESMANSQLAFAGANLSNAGMVTAAEVATMNLRKCDLVVLSACETGLGKLGGDGVFGLQRGFKNSGVHTLLMSLKEVYDESTAELMNTFYRNMINGMSKREALINAQRELRQNGYDDSKYWASFILLDAF